MTALIEVAGLRKNFRVAEHRGGLAGAVLSLFQRQHRTVEALAGVSFSVARGEVVGYLGPNGAGKSTTIKVLTGILVPTAGRVRVNGRVPWEERKRHTERIGVVFGQRTNLWWDLPVIESFDLLRHIYRVPEDRYRANLRGFTELLEIGEFLDTPVRSLSLGQRMRADLAGALLHDPELLFLDEPTIGLDVVGKERIRSFIDRVNVERGVTVLLTTHDLGDVERLSRRILMIDRGALVFDGTLQSLRDRFGPGRELVVDFAEAVDDPQVPGARRVSFEDRRAVFRFSPADESTSEIIGRLAGRYRLLDVTVREAPIDAIIRRIYEERLL